MMIIVVIYMIIDQRDHHLCDQYDQTYHLNPNQADSHPKTSGKLCISSEISVNRLRGNHRNIEAEIVAMLV